MHAVAMGNGNGADVLLSTASSGVISADAATVLTDTLGPGGAVVGQHDAEGLKQALENFLTSPPCRQRAATAGREFALQNYTVESITARYLDVFENARNHHSAGRNLSSDALELESLGRKSESSSMRRL